MDGGAIYYFSPWPDGITIFNRVEDEGGGYHSYVHSIEVGRYGTSKGRIAFGTAASLVRKDPGGEWEERGIC